MDDLQPETYYRVLMFAVNPKGRSEPVIIDGIHFKGITKATANKLDLELSPFLAALSVTAAALFVCTSCVLVALYRRSSRK